MPPVATDIGGGSQFQYALLSVVLMSSLMAMLFQTLCIRLGVVTGRCGLGNRRYLYMTGFGFLRGMTRSRNLAEQCRASCPYWLTLVLYLTAEVAIMATDLAEVIGSAIALHLLFGLPLIAGVLITALDVLIVLKWYESKTLRYYEMLLVVLVLVVGILFLALAIIVRPSVRDVLRGYLPTSELFTNSEMLFLAIGIVGATVMPHNLYLHSNLSKLRRIQNDESPSLTRGPSSSEAPSFDEVEMEYLKAALPQSNSLATPTQVEHAADPVTIDTSEFVALRASPSKMSDSSSTFPVSVSESSWDATASTIRFATLDCVIALVFAMVVNSIILIVGGAVFYKQDIHELEDAYRGLNEIVGQGSGILFAVALLVSGQSSTITGTMAGQVVMLGFLDWKVKPWIRRLVTRLMAILPAVLVLMLQPNNGLNQLLILTQVILSIQLPFAVIPLVYFTSSVSVMGGESRPPLMTQLSDMTMTLLDRCRRRPAVPDRSRERVYVTGWLVTILGTLMALFVTVCNVYLVITFIIRP